MAASISIDDFISQIKSSDKDFRYMAISDLERKLEGGIRTKDWSHNANFVMALLTTLQDITGDISAMGVKCIGLLVATDSRPKTDLLARELGAKLYTGKKNNNTDIVGMALKALIEAAPGQSSSKGLIEELVPTLLGAIQHEEIEIQNVALEVLQVLVSKCGSLMRSDHERLSEPLVALLETRRTSAKKRSIQCLGALGPHLTDQYLSVLFTGALEKLQGSDAGSSLTYVQLIASLSRSSGWRLSKLQGKAVPVLIKQSRQADEGEDELKEGCLQALEVIIHRPSSGPQGRLPDILSHALDSLSYDPNYAEDMSTDGDDEGEDEGSEEEEEYSDDDDSSWKVRKAAVRLLNCIIANYPEILADVYSQTSKVLIARFKERDENVKMDILNTFAALIAQVGTVKGQQSSTPLISSIHADFPKITKAACRQISHKSLKVKAGVLQLLRDMLLLEPAPLAAYIPEITPGLIPILKDASTNAIALRIQALDFLAVAFREMSFDAWKPNTEVLADAVCASALDKYYRTATAALLACESFATAMRPQPSSGSAPPEAQGLIRKLCTVIDARLSPQDQDQEVKEAAILFTAAAIASSGDLMGPSYEHYLQVLVERLKNDITRLPAIKAFVRIADSPLQLSLSSIQHSLVTHLLSYLQMANRTLRQGGLDALDAVLQNAAFSDSLPLDQIARSVAPLVDDSDMLLTASALHVGVVLLQSQNNAGPAVADSILKQALQLAQSPLLQATALNILKDFLVTLLNSRVPGISAQGIQTHLIQAGSQASLSKASQLSIAQCIACLAQAAGESAVSQTLQSLIATLEAPRSTTGEKNLALLAIGEVGRLAETSNHGDLFQTLLTSIRTFDEELKAAAAVALGAVSSGQLPLYLPRLLQTIRQEENNPHQQYLLLQALLELLSSIHTQQLPLESEQQAAAMLLGNQSSEEDCRNVVAGCLGQLALLAPNRIVPVLFQHVEQGSASQRVVMITALRMAVTDQPHPVDQQLASVLPQTLQRLSDPDWRVRRATVQLLGITANNKVDLVRDYLPQLLPQLYQQTVVDQSLIRTVDLGPFKHTQDDGLSLRKAAFESLEFLLDNAPETLQFSEFVSYLQNGIVDDYDIKMPCHLLLAKVAVKAGDQILGSLDQLVPGLDKTLSAKTRTEAVKQEVDKNDDMVRSCMRAVEACSRIPNIESCLAFQDLLKKKVLQPPLDVKFKAVAAERAELEGRTTKAT